MTHTWVPPLLTKLPSEGLSFHNSLDSVTPSSQGILLKKLHLISNTQANKKHKQVYLSFYPSPQKFKRTKVTFKDGSTGFGNV